MSTIDDDFNVRCMGNCQKCMFNPDQCDWINLPKKSYDDVIKAIESSRIHKWTWDKFINLVNNIKD